MLSFSNAAIDERENKISIVMSVDDSDERCRYTLSLTLTKQEHLDLSEIDRDKVIDITPNR